MDVATEVSTESTIKSIIHYIIALVPTSYWAFGTSHHNGAIADILEADGACASDVVAFSLQDELRRQSESTPAGPKLTATLSPHPQFEFGMTLVLGDAYSTFGILVLLRESRLGTFTLAERHMLAISLAAAGDFYRTYSKPRPPARRARGLRLHSKAAELHAADAFYVLDCRLRIKLAYAGEELCSDAQPASPNHREQSLPQLIEGVVRELTAGWYVSPFKISAGMARPVPFLLVRAQPMSGAGGLHIGVRVERFRTRTSLAPAADRFGITPREVQVLIRLLDGMLLEEISTALNITVSTVQDHVRNMIEKTDSRNRSELLGRVLGWESEADRADGPVERAPIGLRAAADLSDRQRAHSK